MLDTRADHLDYGKLLEPPPDYELDFAICFTYSLDLEALMGSYLALGCAIEPDTDLDNDEHRAQALATLESVSRKVLVFCEKGKIRTSRGYRPLYSQIENGIVEVSIANEDKADRSLAPSFHPKMWLLKFKGKSSKNETEDENGASDTLYRLCILSRNLTFDFSWDFAGTIEGNSTADNVSAGGNLSQSLERILNHFRIRYDEVYIERLKSIIVDMKKVYFHRRRDDGGWRLEPPILFSSPWSNPGKKGNDLQECFSSLLAKANRLIAISPFISDYISDEVDPLEAIYERCMANAELLSQSYIVTRLESLTGHKSNIEKLKVLPLYTIREDALKPASEASEGNDDYSESQKVKDIHAKVYAFEVMGKDGIETHMLFGSANATKRAFDKNYEMMMHISTNRAEAFDNLVKDLGLDENSLLDESLFEKLDESQIDALCKSNEDASQENQRQRAFDSYVKQIQVKMTVNQTSSPNYSVQVHLKEPKCKTREFAVSRMALLTGLEAKKAGNHFVFDEVELQKLTRLIRIYCNRVANDEYDSNESQETEQYQFITVCEVDACALHYFEERKESIIQSECTKSIDTLMDYIEFKLSDNPELLLSLASKRYGNAGREFSLIGSGIYERLLKSYLDDGEHTHEVIDDCLERFKSEHNDRKISEFLELLKNLDEGNRNVGKKSK